MLKKSKIEKAEMIVARRLVEVKFTHLRHVIVLKGLNDDGKTSVLKTLIGELYRLSPQSWRSPRKYDPSRVVVSVETSKVEYQAVFEYKGVRIVITTAGDTSNVIAWNFEYSSKHQVEVAIMAVRVSDGDRIAAAEYAYKKAMSMVSVSEHVVDITGRRVREKDRTMVVKEILSILDEIVKNWN